MEPSIQHIAIIMDGNRRWANKKKAPISSGYLKGVSALKKIIQYFVEQRIPYLTLFAFSTENWKRPKKEVLGIFGILASSILKHETLLKSHQICLHTMGNLNSLPDNVKEVIQSACHKTRNHSGLNLILAVNYGGRQEIIDGIRKMLSLKKKAEDIVLEDFESCLQSSRFPPPDLVIRTGGVQRISNFCLWSSAYSEFYFSCFMWPDFNVQELEKAIHSYKTAGRRFGGS